MAIRNWQEQDYRGVIALIFSLSYVILLAVALLFCPESVERIAAIFGPPTGVIIGFYFKGRSDNV